MSTNWKDIINQAINAAKAVIGGNWSTVKTSAIHSIQQLAQTAQYIKANDAKLSPDERSSLIDTQKQAMQVVLLSYQDIGIAIAQGAVAAAWAVIEGALTAALIG
jgi:hypothetical protein